MLLPQLDPVQFAQTWRDFSGNEEQGRQDHFNQLCHLVGHETPIERNALDSFTFEKATPKSDGSLGKADVWLADHFLMEYKAKGGDLEQAYAQALGYRDSLGNPPLIITCDFNEIQIRTNFTGKVSVTYLITLEDIENLGQPAKQRSAAGESEESYLSVAEVLASCFYDPRRLEPVETPEELTSKAADIFKDIHDRLVQWNKATDIDIAGFLSRLLFCMFASDAALLEKRLITRLSQRLENAPSQTFSNRLNELFNTMSTGGDALGTYINHFNGGLFDGTATSLVIDSETINLIRRADGLDWSQVEPSVFGTMFERVFNPEKRSQLGMHYTSRENIELLVEPVVMKPIRRKWKETQQKVETDERNAQKHLQQFLRWLGQLKVLDPACGSGNFLYVVLAMFHDVEKEVFRWGARRGINGLIPTIHPRQLLGIEIDIYAHQLANVVVWIGHIQQELRAGADVRNRQPILEPLDSIALRNAIIAESDDGSTVPADWPKSDFIIGNPPFLGNHLMRNELGDDVVDRIYEAWEGRVPHGADLCMYWFENARHNIASGNSRRVGLLGTQGIRGGQSRRVLEKIKTTGDIFFAVSDRDWSLDGASVHISMVGFDDGKETDRQIDEHSVAVIHANLTSRSADVTRARKLKENANICFEGVKKSGAFDIPAGQVKLWEHLGNPNGKPNRDVLKPLVNGSDITRRPSDRWIIDFGVNMPENEAMLYEQPYEYLLRHVKPQRATMRGAVGIPWWLHQRPRPQMRQALSNLNRFIVTPRISKHRVFQWIYQPTLPDSALDVFARDDDYFFGVLHSRPHEVWALAMGTQLREKESGFRYTPTTCFETFPFPHPNEVERDQIALAAKELYERREKWLHPNRAVPPHRRLERTLTMLYNDNPVWIANHHATLNQAVFDAYGWSEDPADLDDDTILERLLELNLSREPA